jgi:DNA-directed RNA polymerase specialized sigma24 family protein
MNAERQLDPDALGDHIDRLYRAAWSLCGSREEAEDLVQETFERVLRRPRFIRSEDDVGYLLRVLRNTFFSQRRTAGRRPQTTPLPDDLNLIEDRNAPAADPPNLPSRQPPQRERSRNPPPPLRPAPRLP